MQEKCRICIPPPPVSFKVYSRYIAVCHPFYYRESTTGSSVTMRAVTYVVPDILVSVALNIPKFFETEIIYVNEEHNNQTFTFVTYDLTELRKDPDYIR